MLQYKSMNSKRHKTAKDFVQNVETIVKSCNALPMASLKDVAFRESPIKAKSGVDYIARARRRNTREKSEAQKNIGKRRLLQCID